VEKLEPHYKPSEVAFILGVTTETLRRWEKLGLLKARRLPSATYAYQKARWKGNYHTRQNGMPRKEAKITKFNEM